MLKPGGLAFVVEASGNTPADRHSKIGKRSRDLNLEIGKIEVT